MSLAIASSMQGVYAPTQDRALGPDGAELRESIEQAVAPPGPPHRTEMMLRRISAALKKGTEVEGVLVSAGAFGRMCDVLAALPADVPLPEVVVESGDEIGLDWQNGRRRVVSLTVDSTPFVGFAALIGHETHHGRSPFAGEFPKTIAGLLRQIHPDEPRGTNVA
jgi:hypothetical protein